MSCHFFIVFNINWIQLVFHTFTKLILFYILTSYCFRLKKFLRRKEVCGSMQRLPLLKIFYLARQVKNLKFELFREQFNAAC